MSRLLHLIDGLCLEITSDKLNIRNKAAERLDEQLNNSKCELLSQLSQSNDQDLSWNKIFNSTIEGAIKHALKLDESKQSKNFQALKNKNYMFSSIINKLINYNLEDNNNLLSKTTLLTAFTNGFKCRACVDHFSEMFLNILNQGVLKFSKNIREIKLHEFSSILSYLFETNKGNDLVLYFSTLKAIIKVVEFAQQNVFMSADVMEYYPELQTFMKLANDDARKIDFLKLYCLIIGQYYIDYYHTIGVGIQEMLPTILDYYQYNAKQELKEILFRSLLLSINALFPYLQQGNATTLNLSLTETWKKNMKKLRTIIEIEINERINNRRYYVILNSPHDKMDIFIQLAARVIFLVEWHFDVENVEESVEAKIKILKTTDRLEHLLKCVKKNDEKLNYVWLAILGELLNCVDNRADIINLGNINAIFSTVVELLSNIRQSNELRNIRRCIEVFLKERKKFLRQKPVEENFCDAECVKVIDYLLSDTNTDPLIVAEKQTILQLFISNQLLNLEQCTKVINLFMSNNIYRRSETIETVQCILLNAEKLNFDKTAEVILNFLKWIYDDDFKNKAHMIIMKLKPIEFDLVAKTSALAIINIPSIQTATLKDVYSQETNKNSIIQLFMYKYNRKFICLERGKNYSQKCVRDMASKSKQSNQADTNKTKSCLLQNNYENLMRLLDFENSSDTSTDAILQNLKSLIKVTALMKYLLQYECFDIDSYKQCPLIKRIGLFLSHLELQFKSNNGKNIDPAALTDILQWIKKLIMFFTNNTIMLGYFETQPIEEMIAFLGTIMKQKAKTVPNNIEYGDWNAVFVVILHIFSILCASSSHWAEAFKYISSHKFDINNVIEVNVIIQLTKIFCNHKLYYNEIAEWIIDKLKSIFKLFYANIKIITKVVDIIPNIFFYLHENTEYINVMLVAIHSLLKLCFRKLYPEEVISKIIRCIGCIGQECSQLYSNENYEAICVSVVQLITLNSLDIQSNIIYTLTIIMDNNYLNAAQCNQTCSIGDHYKFCDKIYRCIDWSKLNALKAQHEMNNIDQLKNILAINIQLLIAIIVCSDFHRIEAFSELSYICYLYNLNERDFGDLQQIANYYHTSLWNLLKPSLPMCIHNWIIKSYPILKFPYYLCYISYDKFVEDNLKEIVTFMLLENKSNKLEELSSFGTRDELIKITTPFLRVLLLLQHDDEFNINGINNLQELNLSVSIDYDTEEDNESISFVLYNLMDMLSDKKCLNSLMGDSKIFTGGKRHQISYESLKKALKIYLNGDGTLSLTELIKQQPLSIVKVLSALKRDCHRSIFFFDVLRNFHKFCVFAQILLRSFDSDVLPIHFKEFFARDIIFYIINTMEQVSSDIIKQYAVEKLEKLLQMIFNITSFLSSLITNDCVYICEALVRTIELCQSDDLQSHAQNIIKSFIRSDIVKSNSKAQIMHCFFNISQLAEERDRLMKILTENAKYKRDWKGIIDDFIQQSSYSLESLHNLKQQIFQNKRNLQNDFDLLYQLLRKLLYLARHSQRNDVSLEALKCLGELGPLYLPQASYYFEDSQGDQNIYLTENASFYFYKILSTLIEKQFLCYDDFSYPLLLQLASYLSISKHTKDIVDESYLKIFCVKQKDNYLNSYGDINGTNWLELLKSTEYSIDYESWIKLFTSSLWKKCGWIHLYKLAEHNLVFSETLLIPFIELLLAIDKKCYLPGLLNMLDYYFERFILEFSSNAAIFTIYQEKRIIKIMLQIVECVRIQNNWDLPLQLLNIARACNYCQAYFLSIMYLEMWAIQEKITSKKYNYKIMANEEFQKNAQEAYEAIGCLDAISGFVNPLQSRLQYLNIGGNWTDLLIESTEEYNCNNKNKFYLPILKRNGMLIFAASTMNSTTNNNIDYEIYWRLCRWDANIEGYANNSFSTDYEVEFQKHHFNALKCINNREENNSLSSIDRARYSILNILKGISIECLQSVYKYLTWLELLQQAYDFCHIQFIRGFAVQDILKNWQIKTENLHYGNFQCRETIISHQITLFNTGGVRTKRKLQEFYQTDPVEMSLYRCLKDCRKAGEINLAKRYILLLKNATKSSENTQMKVNALLEDADLCIESGKGNISRAILEDILTNREYDYCLEKVCAMQMKGAYQLDTNSKCFEAVLSKYFEGSLVLLEKLHNSKAELMAKFPEIYKLHEFDEFERKNKCNAYELIGKYADREYSELLHYTNSDQFKLKCKIISINRMAANSVTSKNAKDRDKIVGAAYMKRFSDLDQRDIQAVNEKLDKNLCTAVDNYMQYCLHDESMTSHIIYRIIALWFANEKNSVLQTIIEKHIISVPSYKFVCALNQLMAGFHSKHNEFIQLLIKIIKRCLTDHPHQTLQQLYSILFERNDTNDKNQNNGRWKIAEKIIHEAENNNIKNIGLIIKQFGQVMPALIEFANADYGRAKLQIDLSEHLLRLKNLNHLHCLTLEMPTRIDLEYQIISIVKWSPQAQLVGGVNAPKKLICLCSDGVSRPELLKGRDDLHQDAVMQQLFGMINVLLQKDAQSAQRKLQIRTYKVLPLSQRAGILQWCKNTVPLGVYLKTAHERYRPMDYPLEKCRLLANQHLHSDSENRFKIFAHICQHIKPVLHYFFYEKFHMPGIWFERRLAYINSIATTSIVGYIVSLGDRHCHNLLLDEKTAEMIHIDFGIAFEQGKIMRTPETVPFRLTREILSPMGIGGENGVFKKSCETILSVLRKHKINIMAILEVLLYDPVYMWKVVPRVEDNDFYEGKNSMAQRALLTVQNKLEGKASGLSGTVQIDVEIERLINEATSGRNLCMVYPGWDPYL